MRPRSFRSLVSWAHRCEQKRGRVVGTPHPTQGDGGMSRFATLPILIPRSRRVSREWRVRQYAEQNLGLGPHRNGNVNSSPHCAQSVRSLETWVATRTSTFDYGEGRVGV